MIHPKHQNQRRIEVVEEPDNEEVGNEKVRAYDDIEINWQLTHDRMMAKLIANALST